MRKILVLILFISLHTFAQKPDDEHPLTRILFVLDGSQSMMAKWESADKMTVARRLLSELVDSLAGIDNVELALRVYGHQKPVPPQNCHDTKLEVPFSKYSADKIKDKLATIRPKGTTPIAYSLELSANDFPVCDECRNIIILITDGIEACDGDPCAVSLQLQKRGIILKPFVIGIGLDEQYKNTFDCVGRYYNASNENRFKEILEVVVSQALSSTSLQVNLLDSYNKPTETDVNMTFYDSHTGAMMYNFVHTMNRFGNPDTLTVDPVLTYDIQVHTIPEVWKNSVIVNPGKHNTVDIKAPQGSLLVSTKTDNLRPLPEIVVRESGKSEILNIQYFNNEQKYIIGNYDIDILTIPRISVNIDIKQSETYTIRIPQSGLITFTSSSPPVGDIYSVEGDEITAIYHLNSTIINQTISILPGKYKVIARPINAKESVYTFVVDFIVEEGVSRKVEIF